MQTDEIPGSPEMALMTPQEKTGKKAIVFGAAAALVAATTLGSTYAFNQLKSSDAYPSDHFADHAMAYVQINVDPKAQQKLALNSLAKKFEEELADGDVDFTKDNVNSQVLESFLTGGEELDLTWVGDRMAVAVYPDSKEDEDVDPEIAFMIEVKGDHSPEETLTAFLPELNDHWPAAYTKSTIYGPTGSPTLTEPPAIQGKVVNDEWLAFTTVMPLSEAFPENDAVLANKPVFMDAMTDVQGNIVSSWLDTKPFNDELRKDPDNLGLLTDLKETEISGQIVNTVVVRKDGLDYAFTTENLKLNDELVESASNSKGLEEALQNNSYSNALFSFGVAGLGETLTKNLTDDDLTGLADSMDLKENVTVEELRGLLGDTLTFSMTGDETTGWHATFIMGGVNETMWLDRLDSMGYTLTTLEEELASDDFAVKLTLENNTLKVVLGDVATGSSLSVGGLAGGQVNIDAVIKAFSGASDMPENVGVVEWRADQTGPGKYSTTLSWTTTR